MRLYPCCTCKVAKPLKHFHPQIQEQLKKYYPMRGPRGNRCKLCHAKAKDDNMKKRRGAAPKVPFPASRKDAIARVLSEADDDRARECLIEAVNGGM